MSCGIKTPMAVYLNYDIVQLHNNRDQVLNLMELVHCTNSIRHSLYRRIINNFDESLMNSCIVTV